MIKECYSCENCRRTVNEFGIADGYCCKLILGEYYSEIEDLYQDCPLKKNDNNNIAKWKEVHGYCTPGGDPVYICSVCNSPESEHVYGVEHEHNFKDTCPVCGAKLKYF